MTTPSTPAQPAPVDDARAMLAELLRIKDDRDNHWPHSKWLIEWNNAWHRARALLAASAEALPCSRG